MDEPKLIGPRVAAQISTAYESIGGPILVGDTVRFGPDMVGWYVHSVYQDEDTIHLNVQQIADEDDIPMEARLDRAAEQLHKEPYEKLTEAERAIVDGRMN